MKCIVRAAKGVLLGGKVEVLCHNIQKSEMFSYEISLIVLVLSLDMTQLLIVKL